MRRLLLMVLVLASCGGASNYVIVRRHVTQVETVKTWPEFGTWTSQSSHPNDAAVIVAIEDYAFLPDVDGAKKTASDWEAFFTARQTPVTILVDRNATRETVLKTLDAKKSERLWVVFVGHGAPGADGGLLLGVDTQQAADSISARGITRAELTTRGTSNERVVILDACFSGRDSNGKTLVDGLQPIVPIETERRSGVTVLTAAKSDEFSGSIDGLNRPAFSYFLLASLKGWGDTDEIYASNSVDFAKAELRGAKGRTQTPVLEGDDLLLAVANESRPNVKVKEVSSQTVERTFIDTGQGVLVEKPSGDWTLPAVKPKQGKFSRAAIHFQNAHGWLVVEKSGAMASPRFGRKVEMTIDPVEQRIGKHVGFYGEWFEYNSDDQQKRGSNQIGFVTSHQGTSWRFWAIASSNLDQVRDDLRALVEAAEFE